MSVLVTKETTKAEMDAVYKTYPDTAPEGFQPFHSSRVNPIFWDIPEGSSVLDIGCNSGEFMKRLLDEKRNVKVIGLDLSETAVKAAQAKGLDVVLGDGESIPFPDRSFDYVVLMEVIVHVHDAKKLLKEIKRVLKKDGVLIGSSPLKDLEMGIWDDRRLHHAYYTSNELHALLKEFFYDVHMKILNGAQFAIGFAGSALGDKPVEALFKCGSENMKPWDYVLLDKSTLRVWMGPTQQPGDVYYRMTGFAEKMNKLDKCDVLYNRFEMSEFDGPGSWQQAFQRAEGNRPANMIVVNQLEGLLKISDLSIWQLTGSHSVLAFFHTLKAVHPDKPFITETDDWVFDLPSYNLASNPYRPNSEMERVAYQQIQISDVVIVSTEFIKENLEQIFPGKKIYVIPNALDFDIWDNLKRPEKEGKIRIGYTGCGNHSGDMEMVKAPILALMDEFPNLEFVMSTPFESWQDVERPQLIRNTVWCPIEAFPQMVANWNMDIGIAPLRDSNFNRAKSNLRWLEYSALGIPCIASNVYPFAKSIHNEVDGIVCSGQKAWYENLRSLIVDKSKRTRMGAEAYRRVKKDFNMAKVAEHYRDVLEVIKRGS